MFPTYIPFPNSGDKENIPVNRSEKRAKRNGLIDAGKESSKRPLLQRVISKGQPITILTNPSRTVAQSVPPTIYEKVTRSPLSTIYGPSPSSPLFPRASVHQSRSAPRITIVGDLEKEKREAHPRSPPKPKGILIKPDEPRSVCSVQTVHWSSPSPGRITILSNPEKEKRKAHPRGPKSILTNPAAASSRSHSHPHITILSNPEREKREAHPLSPSEPPSILLSRSAPYITIFSNKGNEKREAHPRSTKRTKNIRNTVAAALALKRVPTITITPISILKARTPPPQAPSPVSATDAKSGAVKEKVVKFVLSDIVVQETVQGDRDPDTGACADKTLISRGELLSVPLVDWRGRLDKDEHSRYYPMEHSKANRLRSMVRSGSRSATARRRDHARRRRETVTTATPTATPAYISLILSLTGP